MAEPTTAEHGPGDVLTIENVSVRFRAIEALDDVTLRVTPGGFVGLIGPNGAGKTTMFNVVSGFTRPRRGHVYLDGTQIQRWSPMRRARRGIVRTFQNVGLNKHVTVDENMRAAWCTATGSIEIADFLGGNSRRRRAAAETVDEHLSMFGLEKHRSSRVADISTGTAKLVELACALIRAPRLLLLDEPSSGLSPDETNMIGAALLDIHRRTNLAILMIEHDMSLVMRTAEYVYCLDFGRLIAEGSPFEIRRHQAVLDAYLGEET